MISTFAVGHNSIMCPCMQTSEYSQKSLLEHDTAPWEQCCVCISLPSYVCTVQPISLMTAYVANLRFRKLLARVVLQILIL
jgi:hypothetical protein